MLLEYALIPDIFRTESYSSVELADTRLQVLRPILLEEALIRNYRAGEWLIYIEKQIKNSPESFHTKAKELLKQLNKPGDKRRIRDVSFFSGNPEPESSEQWLLEALDSHIHESLNGIIALPDLKQQKTYKNNSDIIGIDSLTTTDWEKKREQSRMIRLRKQTSDYSQHLRLLFGCANSIQIIDPYLDPTQNHYKDFFHLLRLIRDSETLIELHIAAKGYSVDGTDRSTFTLQEWKSRFSCLIPTLQERQLKATIFLWESFHDRYIITNLMGILLSSGLDVIPRATVDWVRQTRQLRDRTQADFNLNSSTYHLKFSFTLS